MVEIPQDQPVQVLAGSVELRNPRIQVWRTRSSDHSMRRQAHETDQALGNRHVGISLDGEVDELHCRKSWPETQSLVLQNLLGVGREQNLRTTSSAEPTQDRW